MLGITNTWRYLLLLDLTGGKMSIDFTSQVQTNRKIVFAKLKQKSKKVYFVSGSDKNK